MQFDIKNPSCLIVGRIFLDKIIFKNIIATAIYLNLALITSDIEFKKVNELTLIYYEY